MLSWFIRALLFLSGIVTGWFLAREDMRFEIVQMVVAMAGLVGALAVIALWKRRGAEG